MSDEQSQMSYDELAEMSFDELLDEKLKAKATLDNIKNQLTASKSIAFADRDPAWFNNATRARRHWGRYIQRVEIEVGRSRRRAAAEAGDRVSAEDYDALAKQLATSEEVLGKVCEARDVIVGERDEALAHLDKSNDEVARLKDGRADLIFELYETKAALFYLETGLLAPGKDWPAMAGPRPKGTNHRWDEWNRERGFGDGCQREDCEFCAAEGDDEL